MWLWLDEVSAERGECACQGFGNLLAGSGFSEVDRDVLVVLVDDGIGVLDVVPGFVGGRKGDDAVVCLDDGLSFRGSHIGCEGFDNLLDLAICSVVIPGDVVEVSCQFIGIVEDVCLAWIDTIIFQSDECGRFKAGKGDISNTIFIVLDGVDHIAVAIYRDESSSELAVVTLGAAHTDLGEESVSCSRSGVSCIDGDVMILSRA